MPATIGTTRELIAGHFLPKVPIGHKCSRPHGHNYRIDIEITGPVQENGFIIDFYDLDKIVDPLFEMCDHRMLNDIEGLENPTAEIISFWFREKIQKLLPDVTIRVKVWETPTCYAISERVSN